MSSWLTGVALTIRAAARFAARSAAKAAKAALRSQCAWCGVDFQASSKGQKFCCRSHNNTAKARRRKLLIRDLGGSLPSIGEIYERDGGQCGLCLQPVDRSLVWPNRDSASIDHIVPITKGGRDEAANVQLAHLGCNMSKGNRVAAAA